MSTLLVILGLGLIAFLFLLHMLSQYRTATLDFLEEQRREIQGRYDEAVSLKKELKRELREKEQAVAKAMSNRTFQAVSMEDLELAEKDSDTENVSRYLLTQQKITLEQHEKVKQKMGILKMDYLGVCMALGYIDLKTSQQATKASGTSKLK